MGRALVKCVGKLVVQNKKYTNKHLTALLCRCGQGSCQVRGRANTENKNSTKGADASGEFS